MKKEQLNENKYNVLKDKLLENNLNPDEFNESQILTLAYYMDKLSPEHFARLANTESSHENMEMFGDSFLHEEQITEKRLRDHGLDTDQFSKSQIGALGSYFNRLSPEHFDELTEYAKYYTSTRDIGHFGNLLVQEEKWEREQRHVQELRDKIQHIDEQLGNH